MNQHLKENSLFCKFNRHFCNIHRIICYFYKRWSIVQTSSIKTVWKQSTSEFFAKMEKSEFRVLIKPYFLRSKTLSETKAKLDKYYSDSAPSYGMVQKWFTEFRSGRTSTETIPSPGGPNEITTPEMINKIHNIVLNDPKVKVREIAEIVSTSTERVVNILHTHLCKRKLCARRGPRLLTIDQKHIRVTTS